MKQSAQSLQTEMNLCLFMHSLLNSPAPNKTKIEELKQPNLISKPTGMAESKYSQILPILPELH